MSHTKSQKKNSRRGITKEDIKKYWHLPQTQAAAILGVCVSTLKRHFYALYPNTKWPYIPYQQRKRQIKRARVNGVDPRLTIPFICNTKNIDPVRTAGFQSSFYPARYTHDH